MEYVFEDVPLVEFMYLVFTCMPGESYCRWLRSLLLCSCDVFRALINSLCLLYLFVSVCLSVSFSVCRPASLCLSISLSVIPCLSLLDYLATRFVLRGCTRPWILSVSAVYFIFSLYLFTWLLNNMTRNIVCIIRVLYYFSICLLDYSTTRFVLRE